MATTNPIVNQIFSSSDDKKKKQQQQHKPVYNNSYETPFEAFRDLGKDVAKDVKQNSKAAVTDAWRQLLGSDKLLHKPKQSGGDLQPGQELDLKAHQEQKSMEKQANNLRPGIDYVGEILRAGETSAKEEQKNKEDIQNLIHELKSLAGATAQLEKQVVEATGATIVSPGKYHKSFFRWVISVVQDAREKIDNASSFLSAMSSKNSRKGLGAGKKKQSNNYWDKAKQHGSKFTLSGERAVSNQVG